MRSAPTAACEIHANVEPLGKRREKAALELFEKAKRGSCDNPNKEMVDNWEPKIGSNRNQSSIVSGKSEKNITFLT